MPNRTKRQCQQRRAKAHQTGETTDQRPARRSPQTVMLGPGERVPMRALREAFYLGN
jgi:hypothetical protein